MKSAVKPTILAYRDVVWTEEIDQAIGKESDSIIGRRFGISPRSILVRRRKLGRLHERTKSESIVWTKKMDKQLGTMRDTELAKKLGLTPYWVRQRRKELGVSAHVLPETPKSNKPKNRLNLTPGRIASLGKSSDAFLASRWGVSSGTVTRVRQQLGIEPFTSMKEIDWTKTMLNLLGEVPDGRIAREYMISGTSVKIKRISLRIPPFGKTEMDPEPVLPDEVIQLLGKVPDKQISDQYRIPRIALRLYRAFHDIPLADYSPPSHHDWKDHEIALLGTKSDGAVARQLKIPRDQVCHKRRTLRIAPFDRQGTVRWTTQIIAKLGSQPDQALARRWKIPQRDVTAKRVSLNIAECKQQERKWTKAELKQLGAILDTELAEQLSISPTLVAKKRMELQIPAFKNSGPFEWKPAMLKRLGLVPDDELALELGVSYQFVAAKRGELGIPAMRRSSLKWTDEIVKQMGKKSDAQIAKQLGRTAGLVRLKRIELGIAPYQK